MIGHQTERGLRGLNHVYVNRMRATCRTWFTPPLIGGLNLNHVPDPNREGNQAGKSPRPDHGRRWRR